MLCARCLLCVVGGLLLVACGGPTMQVEFHSVPSSVESYHFDSCRMVSRSAVSHILRVALLTEQGGQQVRPDNDAVKVTVKNVSRNLSLATVDVKSDGQPHEIMLHGPAQAEEVLELSGSFSVEGKLGEFAQRCRID